VKKKKKKRKVQNSFVKKKKIEMGLKFTFCWVCLLLCLLVWVTEAQIFNVKDYGAIADGATDNSEVIHMTLDFNP
jgi:hypothetical protein